MPRTIRYIGAIWLATISFACLPARYYGGIHLDQVELPPGFKIELYAEGLPGARSLAMSPAGTLIVGTRDEGVLYAVPAAVDDSGRRKVITLAEGLNSPNGVAFNADELYVAEIGRILRYEKIDGRLKDPPDPQVVNDSFPEETRHGWKYIAFAPDGRLYIPVGAPCNVCLAEDPRFSSILRMYPDGSGLEIFARGVRNTVGFDWHPESGVLWFTNNGRDWMGDDLPPDTLHRAPRPGLHFGFPYCHAGTIADPKYGDKRPCSEFVQPEIRLGAHVAALGMKFYTGSMFPSEYRNQIFIAEHGSWNRTAPVGYRITLVRLEGSKAVRYDVFAKGWLQGEKAWGRPVDVLVAPDGALLVSDDRAGAVYRISYNR